MKDSYYNMKEKIEPHMDLIDKAKDIHGEAGYPANRGSDPGRHGWSKTVIYGAALSEPVHRRP